MENAFCVAIDLEIFTMNVLIPETLHTMFYDLFWVLLLGFGLDGSYKQNSVCWRNDLLDCIQLPFSPAPNLLISDNCSVDASGILTS